MSHEKKLHYSDKNKLLNDLAYLNGQLVFDCCQFVERRFVFLNFAITISRLSLHENEEESPDSKEQHTG